MNKKLLYIIPILAFIFIPKDVFAWESLTSVDLTRSYAINDSYTSSQDVGTVYIPHTIIGYNENQDRFLYGIRVNKELYFSSPDKFTTLTVDVNVRQDEIYGPNSLNEEAATSFAISTADGGSYGSSCSIYSKDNSHIQWRCSYTFDNYVTITGFRVRIGIVDNVNQYTPFLGALTNKVITDNGLYPYSNNITLPYVGYDIVTSADKNTEILKDQLTEQEKTNTKIDETNKELGELNDKLTNSNTTEAEESANGFFNDFNDDDYGLSDIITMPLTFIRGLSNNSCNSLNLPLPFVDQNVILPCMTSIYETHFGSFLTIYQTITTGFISYWVCINIFRMVQGFKNPDNDEVEVMDL